MPQAIGYTTKYWVSMPQAIGYITKYSLIMFQAIEYDAKSLLIVLQAVEYDTKYYLIMHFIMIFYDFIEFSQIFKSWPSWGGPHGAAKTIYNYTALRNNIIFFFR